MKTRISTLLTRGLPLAVLMCTGASAQVPVDEDGNVIGRYETADAQALKNAPATGNEGIPLLDAAELEELVGPVALYPDDLLAIVLPASTYPLQVVQAARFLEDLEDNPGLKPDPEWDDSIIALINYPEVVELLNEDLDWTWRLGEAVVAQQADVVNAVENFRDRAYAAGNLKSDGYQTVERNEGVIEITPVNEEIIYVPYYEPERVVYYQPRPVYYYYPRPCPVYYYPYPSGYAFSRPYFWGVTTAFTIGWTSNHLRVFHHSYRGHPYFGRHYYDRWWYRRPDIHIYNNVYSRNTVNVTVNRYVDGDYWRPSRATRLRASDQRITRNTHYRERGTSSGTTTINRYVNNSRDAGEDRRVTRSRSGRNGEADTTRLTSQEQMRRTINQVQRERGVDSRDLAQRQRQTTIRGQSTQRESQNRRSTDRRTTTREDGNSRVTQQQIARQFAEQRQVRERAPAERQATQRRAAERRMPQRDTAARPTSQRQSVQRQTTQRQTAQRQTVQRQSTERQTAQRQTTQRQTSQRQTSQRQTSQRQTSQRQTSQRQTSQRQSSQRQTSQRQTSQRQTSKQQSTQRQSSGGGRSESSNRSQSNRERRQRR